MVRGDGDVVGLDSDPVQRLHPQDVAVGVAVGEDARVGDAELLQVAASSAVAGCQQRQVEVDRVEPAAVEEVVAPGGDRLREVGARLADGDQRQVVVLLDLDVQVGARSQLEVGRRLGEGAAQLASSIVRATISRWRAGA